MQCVFAYKNVQRYEIYLVIGNISSSDKLCDDIVSKKSITIVENHNHIFAYKNIPDTI